MARTISTDLINPEILTEAVKGQLAKKNAFMGSAMARLGAVVINGSMPEGGPKAIGQQIKVPYFNFIGKFASNAESSSGNFMQGLTPKAVKQTSELATISRSSLSFEVDTWAQGNAYVNPQVGDPYEEASRQIGVALDKEIDSRIVTAASASGVPLKDVYSSTSPVTLSWDLIVDAKFESWGDEQDDIVGFLTHSQGHKDLLKLKDSTGRPLLLEKQNDSDFDRFCGMPVVVSDECPITGSAMGSITSSGTSPPVATLTGTPLGPWKLVIDAQTGDATTITFKFSTDNGQTWSAVLTAQDNGTPVALTDTATDSLVGYNGETGISVAFASGTFNADNLWTSTASLKVTSMLIKKSALAFWYASGHLGLKTAEDIYADSDIGAMHLYAAAHRYRRMPMGTKPGVIQVTHNVSGY